MLSRQSITVLIVLTVIICVRPVMAKEQAASKTTAINTESIGVEARSVKPSDIEKSVIDAQPAAIEKMAAANPDSASPAEKTTYPAAFTKPVNTPVIAANQRVGSGVISSDPVMVVMVLLFTVLLIVAIAWFMRRIGAVPTMGGQLMKIVSVLSVGTREKVILIEVGGKQVLLGVAPGRVSHLQSFDEPVVTPSATTGSYDFTRTIKKLLKQQSADQPIETNSKQNNGTNN
ncbi:MAG: flagellar biosynthetic protein FliO [Spongiibacteraceae bacterium]